MQLYSNEDLEGLQPPKQSNQGQWVLNKNPELEFRELRWGATRPFSQGEGLHNLKLRGKTCE